MSPTKPQDQLPEIGRDAQALKEDPVTTAGKGALFAMQQVLKATTRHDALSILGALAREHGMEISIPKPPEAEKPVEQKRPLPPRTSLIRPPQKPQKTDGYSKFDKFGRVSVRELDGFTRYDDLFVQSQTTDDGKILVMMSKYPVLVEGCTLIREKNGNQAGSQHIRKSKLIQLRDILTPEQETLRAKLQKKARGNTNLNDTVGVHKIGDITILTEEQEPEGYKGKPWKRTVTFGTQEDYAEIIKVLQEAIDIHKQELPTK